VKLTGYHGLTASSAIVGDWWHREVYVAYTHDFALDVSRDGVVYAVEYEARKPLILARPQDFISAWIQAGANERMMGFATQKRLFTDWARRLGFDAICLPPSTFEGELGYDWVAGIFGEPQMILLDPARAAYIPTTPSPGMSPDSPSSHPRQL